MIVLDLHSYLQMLQLTLLYVDFFFVSHNVLNAREYYF